ncbi:MAG: haloacid dehalogenase type II [Hyphomicrobiaceae bacterium]
MKLTDFEALTFDCYGTLIDWETGIWNALQPLVTQTGRQIGREEALVEFSEHESAQEHDTPSLRYDQLLSATHARMARAYGVRVIADMNIRFGGSVPDWPAFTDSAEALAYLKRHYKLVILSNVDRTSFASSNKKLGVTFDAIYTAEDIGSYKPDAANFDYLVRHMASDLGVAKDRILHTAQSLFHDHVPAEAAGLARCWINRRGEKGLGSGATKAVARMPKVHFEFPTLAAMAEAHRKTAG